MRLFRRRRKITSAELAGILARQIAHPSEDVQRSLRVTAQKMQPRAKQTVQAIGVELLHLRAYMLATAARAALDGEAGGRCHRDLQSLLEAEPEFWTEFSTRAAAYDAAMARLSPGTEPDLAVMATFQELLGNPDPDTLLLGLRAWHQFSGTADELRKFLRSLRLQ